MSYEKILLTTDGSDESEAAVEHAVNLASDCGAELHILFVVDIGVNTSFEGVENLMSRLESNTDLEEFGTDIVEDLAEEASESGIKTVTSIRKGSPHREILDYASEEDIDVIVMSTHGRSGLDRMLLGSVTEKVLRKSKTPVLTITRDQ